MALSTTRRRSTTARLPRHVLRIPRRSSYTSSLRSERLSAILGIALGIAFAVCFFTGLASHLIQHPVSWLEWPAEPASLYRWITATHTITGVASVPLLFAKLWVAYPKLWDRPVIRSVSHALQRLSLILLVGGSLLLLAGGTSNHFYWYPNPRYFTPTHYWLGWITVGALLIHIGTTIGVTRSAMRRRSDGADAVSSSEPQIKSGDSR